MNCVPKSIFPCIETLKSVEGNVAHLAWHQARFERTRRDYFHQKTPLFLSDYLHPPCDGVYRVRVEYAQEILNVTYTPYVERQIERFALVEAEISYAHKYANRRDLDAWKLGDVDDVLFTCKGLLQDTTIANVALLIDGVWQTPTFPLLRGTTRERLLASGFLKEALLDTQSLKKATKFAIMNALIGFRIIENLTIKGL